MQELPPRGPVARRRDGDRRTVLVCALIGLGMLPALGGCPALRAKRGEDALKVSRVVLYQNGVGYFERRGRVDGDRVVLRIRPQQIADILKSLTVIDLKQGRAVNIALPIERTQARRLAALPKQVRYSGGLASVARAFRGARARVKARGGSATGRIVGVERISEKIGWRLTVLKDDGALRTFDLAKVRELKVKDRTLELGLRKALDVALNEGSWKPVELTVHLAGSAAHDLLISYVVEMPTWKPAYRVVLDGGAKKALLQGWAAVDNVSGQDWKGVQLSLTAGTPLTFRYDLYTPRYVHRPDLSPRQEATAVAPPPATGGVAGGLRDQKKKGKRSDDDDKSPLPDPSPEPPAAKSVFRARHFVSPRRTITGKLLEKSFRALVGGSRVGSLFRYDIKEPVTIRDRQSALVSILNQRVPAEDILLYRIDTSRKHPYRAVRLKNETPFVLEKGPVSIYREGTFVGEALSARIEPSTSAFIPYALDGRIIVSLDDHVDSQAVELLKIVRGRITCQYKRVARFEYTILNRSKKATTLYIQRRHRTGWKRIEPEKALREKDYYFVPVKLAATGKTKFTIREETPMRSTVGLWSRRGRQAIRLYLRGAGAEPTLKKTLEVVLALKEQVGKLDAEIRRLRRAQRVLSRRQEEVRKNIEVLKKTRGNAALKRKLAKTLATLEEKLSTVASGRVAKFIKRGELRDKMNAAFKAVTLEVNK